MISYMGYFMETSKSEFLPALCKLSGLNPDPNEFIKKSAPVSLSKFFYLLACNRVIFLHRVGGILIMLQEQGFFNASVSQVPTYILSAVWLMSC